MTKIIKSQLSSGVFWLEFPTADLRIVCGCPADTVKHMMKRGVIIANEASDVFHETGPNAILLSDLAVQKGSFANLAEFPVLQMLYRQGMLIPNHPGNTGDKPLLIGQQDQLDAQVQYIHRGNYGLLNEQDMMHAGATAEEAKEFMRMKLKFAFGKIANPEELIETIAVESKPREIKNGVTVVRKAVNIFEFSFEGETIEINLNLGPNETYTPPYQLGRYKLGREYFSIVHSGEGDGWDILRPSMASIIIFQGNVYLIDVGPNIEATLQSLGINISEVEGVFMTHCHDDHFAGLPSLLQSDHRIKFYATPLVRAATVKKLSALMSLDESRFDYFFECHDLETGQWRNVNGLEVKPENSPHPMETTVLFFRAQWGDGYKTYAHLADIASFDVMQNMVTDDPDAPGISQEYFEEVKSIYHRPADVKKIDNGGGLIHGMAKDFEEDTSRKIIFAHTARPLTDDERQIGSGAPFGTEDTLIASNHNFLFGKAHNFLHAYYPELRNDQFRLLLNHEVVDFNPEEVILKNGDPIEYTYFVLTGAVEMLDVSRKTFQKLSAGCFIGDIQGLYDLYATETYRAISFVKALKLPISMYKEFVVKNDTFASISMLAENREILQKSWLFGESIADGIKNKIAAEMHVVKDIDFLQRYRNTRDHIGLITQGHVTLKIGSSNFQVLYEGDGLFEDHAVYDMDSIFDMEFSEHCAIAMIPNDVIRDVPIVQWKLLENINLQMRELANSRDWNSELLEWRNEYSVGIERIDEQHIGLMATTKDLIEKLESGATQEELLAIHAKLVEYTIQHFTYEEDVFSGANYSETIVHKKKHNKLTKQVEDLKDELVITSDDYSISRITNFLKRWILLHILVEDRKYASYILKKVTYDI